MREFMDEDFLLSNGTARELYHGVAEPLPIIDYHCHISPREIYEDRRFENLTQVWLGGDHYKWRLMRANGTPEALVTGDGDDREKFRAFAALMPGLMGNPMYHWSHLELRRYFGITEILSPATADRIYDEANEKLQGWSARRFMTQSRVRAICTTDDPADTLEWHGKLREDETMPVRVLPAFRPDQAISLEKPGFGDYIRKLSGVVGYPIRSAEEVVQALLDRIAHFAAQGCLCADHGLDACMYEAPDPLAANRAFRAAIAGEPVSRADLDAFKTYVTVACAGEYARRDWVMQIHFGCLRNVNRPQFRALGPDTGFDAVNSRSGVENLAPLLNAFGEKGGLPKMILYSLSPGDNTALVSIAQCFQEGGGKVRQGSAWWFNDHIYGMRRQLEDLAAGGVLGRFVGMLTDSRSFLSYTRHEYFRRILCDMIGRWVESGQYPNDPGALRRLVEDICFNNTNEFFGFRVEV